MSTKIIKYALQVIRKNLMIVPGMMFKRCFCSPYTITFSVTDTCNARCTTCIRWKNTDDSQELSLEEWKGAILQLSKWIKPCYISFTGGEPFHKEWFCDLLGYANRLNVYSAVSTNGVAFDIKNCDRIISTHVDSILFSLNSIDPKTHDAFKGVEGLHQKIVSAIDYLKRNSNINIGVSLIISSKNYKRLADFALWVRDLGVDSINFQVIRDTFISNFSEHPSISASEDNPYWKIDDLQALDNQIDLLIKLKTGGLPIVVPTEELRAFKRYFRSPSHILPKRQCLVGFRNLIISSTGRVRLCYLFPDVGNIRECGIKQIWFSKAAQEQRMLILNCKTPCLAACLREFKLSDQLVNFATRVGTH